MATIYSLICWGGKLGKTVTMTIASPCVVTRALHGLRNGTGIVLSTTGALPTGLTAGVTYYSFSTGVNTLNLYDTPENAIAGGATGRINTSGSQSGTHTAKGAYYSGLTDKSRWTVGGTENIYDGIASCYTARGAAATTFDAEAWEIGENFIDDRGASGTTITLVSPLVQIYPINGAGHNGIYDAGYTLTHAATSLSNPVIGFTSRAELSGITVKCTGLGGSGVYIATPLCVVNSCIIIGGGTTGIASYGLRGSGSYSNMTNNVITGFKRGCEVYQSNTRQLYANNLVTGNDTGFFPMTTSSFVGFYYNNIAIGNVALNWGAQPTGINAAGANAGVSGDTPWNTAPNSAITLATTDFVNYAGNNFRPALITSPQVDSAIEYYQVIGTDIAGDERPNYNNGGAEAHDIGPYEFDHGFGPHPASHSLTLTNVVIGSRVFVEDQAKTVVHYDQIATGSIVVITATLYSDSRDYWRIKIRKASEAPYYQPYETLMTATVGSSSIYVSQLPD